MKQNRKKDKSRFAKFIQSPKTTVGIFGLAALLLAFGGIGTAQAIPTITSSLYGAEMSMEHIGVTLIEACNGNAPRDVAWRNYYLTSNTSGGLDDANKEGVLLSNFGKETIVPGKKYNELLSVRNSGEIYELVRVTVRKYWRDAAGKEIHSKELTPDKINLHLVTNGEWVIDEASSTDERTVLYRMQSLSPNQTSGPFADSLTIDGMLGEIVKDDEKSSGNIIYHKYKYNGYSFVIEAEVDAVQTHNAEAAARSAWGRNISVTNTDQNNAVITALN